MSLQDINYGADPDTGGFILKTEDVTVSILAFAFSDV